MGILSLCFVAILAFHVPFIGRGYYASGFAGPCQPFKANQSELCDELQTFVQLDYGAGKFCNDSAASCNLNNSMVLYSFNRTDPFKWETCYCDELCKKIGDCCVDYDMWHAPRAASRLRIPAILTCRRAPSDITDFPFGYIMVARCPQNWNDAKTARACASTNYSADPLTALPVLDLTSNVTYANTYCAMCHGRSRNLHPWTMKIVSQPISTRQPSLQDIQVPDTMWKAVPVGTVIPERCIVTPSEAHTEPDTKVKQLCRSYANGIKVTDPSDREVLFKSPHCAIMEGYNLSSAATIECSSGLNFRVPPFLSTTLFTFSIHAKRVDSFFTKTVIVKYNCSINEVYDPFKGRCLPVQTVSLPVQGNGTNSTEQWPCRGPRFRSNEFRVFSNNSILLLPHQKIYPNDSYILVNQTLILCSNFSRDYIKMIERPDAEKEKPPRKSLTAVHIITYVGFSLSIICLLFLLVTYFLFDELRTYPMKRVMHLSCAMIAMQAVYFASDPDLVSPAVCAVTGALLHFFILASFLWMSTISHNTQKTFSTTGNEDGCQLSLPARTYAVACPVSLMVVFNVIALIRTAFAIKRQGQGNVAATNQRSLPLIVAKLTAVMGITWTLGFLLAFFPTPYVEYPFVIVNSCQGVLICVSFVFKKNVFALYKQRFMTATHPKRTATTAAEQQDGSSRDFKP
ncbi:hypothetical protein ACROYT_G031552 [Oculina patagonica]